jgi:hypothetical protein
MLKTVKTFELKGVALDWAVANCEGWKTVQVNGALMLKHYHPDAAHTPHCYVEDFGYSTDWAQGGLIIERENIKLTPRKPFHDDWEAEHRYLKGGGLNAFGPTPLIAAMRCYVVSKLGDIVEVPEELLKD